MTSDQQVRPRRHTRLWLALSVVAILLILIFVPPLVSIARYKNRVTQLVSTALHRPVRISAVELRILPRPGFLITDLTVQEDPAYGYEPVLHANTVMASIRLSSLWRGELQISRISVDEASLNIVHTANGRWNVEALFQTAASLQNSKRGNSVPPPYLEATHSRINVKNGLEKLPYSLVDADASVWLQDGAWRVRLRAQPARTDVSLDLPDTGILRAEATLHPAQDLEQMPLHVDVDWREAQLGQLSRLLLRSDEGWRGDLTGEVHVDGTPQTAKVTSRLRASGVHRAEFAVAAPVDFDATCSLTYHAMSKGIDHLLCNSPVGDGRARLTGSVAGFDAPNLTLELDRVPVQATLDLLRTMRRDLDESLEAAGAVSGKMSYQPQTVPAAPVPARHGKRVKPAAPPSPFSGNFTVERLRLSSANLSAPLAVPKFTLEPAPPTADETARLTTSAAFIAGAQSPVAVTAQIGMKGFQIALHGPASLSRVRDFAHLAGVSVGALDEITGGPATVNLTSDAQWLSEPKPTLATVGTTSRVKSNVNGTIALREAAWKPAFLPNPVSVSAATLHVDSERMRWDPITFTYGALKGTATLELPRECTEAESCMPTFTAHFGALDAGDVQTALVGTPQKGTFVSNLLARLKNTSPAIWPEVKGNVQIDELRLDPFTFKDLKADLRVTGKGTEVSSFEGGLFGGTVNGTASLEPGDKPSYTVKASFAQVNPQLVADLVKQRWLGGRIDGDTELTMSGLSGADLAASAKGTLRFVWRNGGAASPAPASLAHFDHWTGEASIADGKVTLGKNDAQRSIHKASVQATLTFGTPAQVTFASAAHGPR